MLQPATARGLAIGAHRLLLVLTGVVLASLLVAAPASATVSYAVYEAEAETFRPGGNATVANDHVSLENGGVAWRSTHTPVAESIRLRARATVCRGLPTPSLTLSLDGSPVATVPTSATSWVDITTPVDVSAGVHWLSLSFEDKRKDTPRCTRRVDVDVVEYLSSVPSNTATPGSVCAPTDGGLGWEPPDDSINTWLFGDEAPGYYEIGAPMGPAAGQPAKGVMLLLHGGGWYVVGEPAVAAMRDTADAWRSAGWATVNVTTTGCQDSVTDALWFHDAIRAMAPDAPICATGPSSGAHLALMVAALREDVDCAISHGGPTDLVGLETQEAWTPPGSDPGSLPDTPAHHLAVAAFGTDGLFEMSPLTHAAELADVHVVLATAEEDWLIALDQGRNLAAAITATRPDAHVEVHELSPGTAPWVHAWVDGADLENLWAAEVALAERAAGTIEAPTAA